MGRGCQMDRTAAGPLPRRVLAFGVAAIPVVIVAIAWPSAEGDDSGGVWPAVWPGLLAAGLLGGVLGHGPSGAAIVAGGVAVGVAAWSVVLALTAPPDVDLLYLILGGSGFLAIALVGYGIARSVARSVGDDGRIPPISPGRLLVVAGALAWLVAQFLPAWTYTVLADTSTQAGVWFTFLPLPFLWAPGFWLAWPANLLLAAAWELVAGHSRYGPASWLVVFALVCAIGGIAIELANGSYDEVVEIGTVVWCASFAALALGLAVRFVETDRGVFAPPT